MGDVWLVRHGETEWSRDRRHTGRTDVPLTAYGEEQARGLSRRLDRPWAAVLSSPLSRAWRTAELAGLTPKPEPDLAEWDYGYAEGRTSEELGQERPGWSIWSAEGLGETIDQVAARARRVLERVAPALEAGDVCLVAHGHTLRILATAWLGLAPTDGRLLALSAASVSVLGTEHGRRAVWLWNA